MSRNLCCVSDCHNSKHQKPSLSFHNFPTREPHRLKEWVEFCDNQTISKLYETNDTKLEHKAICSQHFADNAYNNPMKKIRLMCNAVPTIKYSQNTNQSTHTKSQPSTPVIRVLMRPNLSRSWDPIGDNAAKNITQSESDANATKLKAKSHPIIKHYSEKHLRYENEIRSLREKLKKSKKQVMNLRYRLKRTEAIGNSRKSKLNYIIKCIKSLDEEALNPVLSEIIEYHLTSAFLNKTRVQKWSNKMKKFCADLYHKSPNAYCYLQKTLTLPTKKTILRFIEERTQSVKRETLKQTTIDSNVDNMDSDVNQMIEKFTEHPVISLQPIDDILTNNELNNICYNEKVCDGMSAVNDIIDTNPVGVRTPIKTTQITELIIENYSPDMKTYGKL